MKKLIVFGMALATFVAFADNKEELKSDPKEETWHGSINGAFTAQRGNSYENTGSLLINVNRRWEEDRLNVDFGYHFSETGTKSGADKKKTEDRWNAMAQHDHFWSTAFYSYENLHFERDEIQELDSRYRVGLGLGYQWLEGADFGGKWNFNQELGANWVREEYAGEPNSHKGGFAAIRYAHHLTYVPTYGNSLEFFHNLEFLPNAEDLDKYLAQVDIGFTTKLIGNFDLLAKVEWDFNSKPAQDRRKSDLRYIVGLGYKW